MRSVAAILALLIPLLFAGCSLFPDIGDESAGWTAEKLYGEAKEAMTDGAYDKAVKLFEKLESRYPYGRYAQQAQLEVAYAYYRQSEAASAISACERFIKLHPNHPNVDYAYYLKGLVSFNEDLGLVSFLSNEDLSERDPKAARESFDTFKELAIKFPYSKYTPDATERMKYLVNTLAAYEVHVARYYLRRGAYVAAANRAQAAIKGFPGAPSNEEALFVMIAAYGALGLAELKSDSERIMRKNFPQSAYLSGGPANQNPWWRLW